MVAAKVRRSVFAQVGEIVFLLSRHPVFADEPGLVPRQMLLTLVPDPLWWSVGDPHADSSKTSLELSFGSCGFRELRFVRIYGVAHQGSAAR